MNMQRDGNLKSIWQDNIADATSTATVYKDEIYDVLIVGAGITGITTGLLLQKAGRKVVITEAVNLGFGTTGGTTAHLNNFFDSSYDEVISNFGIDNAKLLAEAGEEVMHFIKENVREYNIDCGYEQKDGFIFSVEEKQNKILEDLVDGTKKAGLSIDYINENPFPIPCLKIARMPNQAQFNPLEYIHALAREFENLGGIILQQCRVEGIEEGDILEVKTTSGIIQARYAVYATHIPPGVNLLHFRCAPYRSYAVAATLKNGDYPDALGYDLHDPYHYYRSQVIKGQTYLIAGGEDHKTGHEENALQCFRKLEAYLSTYFDIDEIVYKWSSQYYVPVDGLPYIGHLPGNAKNIFTATGFNGNGMIFGSLSAIILCDLITGKENKYSHLFSPSRVKPVAGFSEFVKEAADVVGHLVGDWFKPGKIDEFAELAAGEAKVIKYDGHTLAVYKDEGNQLHAVDAACTHIKCVVAWNNAEKSWDCPCHGSRFSFDGELLTAPARKDLKVISLEKKEA
jgi:glycine/D-amino acid oxidase-like deaminating enzyme/nitrite reductase/ring-hydroxylating ferredoxin subunit